MSKRELGQLNASEVEGPRAKRRRETVGASSDVDVVQSDPVVPGKEDDGQEGGAKEEGVKELGLKLWQTVKDAVNKEGRTLSLDFLRRPSKRQYPDYYQLIQRPIALEDIKKQLENDGYSTLETVKQDFELCFNNAKQYNMKESDIWKDAKELLKLVHKTYNKMVPSDEDGENAEGDDRKNKSKAPNLTRLMKSRLHKLVAKTDDSGRILSVEFMDLPSKKEWPIYYKEIKRPQCLENIFKRVKRKEYHTAGEFAADVELVFANAMAFNQEHTGIWEDAKALRDYFRILMSDLPPPYALPEYTKPSNTKIKLKIPQPAQPTGPSSLNPPIQPSASSSLVVRVPATSHIKASPAPTPIPATVSLPIATATPPPAHPMTLPSTQSIQVPTGSTQPVSYVNPTFSHYPNASYIPPVAPPILPVASASTSNLPTNHVVPAHSVSISPAPPLHSGHQLKSINMRIEPRGRSFKLDYRDGVKCWAMRLVPGEKEIHVDQVLFISDEEEESSDEEGDEEPEGKHEEEEEESMEVDMPAKNGRKKGKGKGRGRPKKVTRAVAAKAKDLTAKKKKQKVGPIQVKLNGSAIKEREDEGGKWTINPLAGSNVLEIGETGGLVWKVYIQRMGDA
ncbi:Protein polybromo-1 [Hypsizygus marmoreus]|uniref:Protein polybromo-1 n=1 Tax=Hypsizygus marmoreus TaxID=39966 RepID=A0A369KC00_HYPMA|nr:Protein polybromo-1 [Hypsizygus marmoreus]